MSGSDVEFLKCRAALASSRMRRIARGLPDKIAHAVDPSEFVREHPIGSVAGTIAICTIVTRSLASSTKKPSAEVRCKPAAEDDEHESGSVAESTLLAALVSPVLSFAARQLLNRLLASS